MKNLGDILKSCPINLADGYERNVIKSAMQAHTNQTLQELKAKVEKMRNEEQEGMEGLDWDSKIKYAHGWTIQSLNQIITLIDEAIND